MRCVEVAVVMAVVGWSWWVAVAVVGVDVVVVVARLLLCGFRRLLSHIKDDVVS